jgi:hypothetical protein
MNCLIVRAHPLEENLTRRFSDFASGRLEATGHKVSLIDLYAEDFDPRLTAAERASYYADKYDRSGMERHIEALGAAEMLVLAFPTWWFGPPAIMKGWLDRVMAPGVAFDHGRDFGPIEPKLLGLRSPSPRWARRGGWTGWCCGGRYAVSSRLPSSVAARPMRASPTFRSIGPRRRRPPGSPVSRRVSRVRSEAESRFWLKALL